MCSCEGRSPAANAPAFAGAQGSAGQRLSGSNPGRGVVPVGPDMVLADINVGLLYLLAVSSLGVYGVIIAGWASNSKYPFYSALRAAAQMVSYEVAVGFVLVPVVLWAGSFNLSAIVEGQRGH